MKFSHHEKKDLFFAALMISLAFAILLSGGYQALLSANLTFLYLSIAAFLTAGLGFLLHEIMHKYVAQSYGLRAEFQAYYPMLWLAIVFSFFGFIFAAPGAVMIQSFRPLSREKNGKISIAGPATNIVLAIIFLILALVFGKSTILGYGLTINSLLAAFNMIPVMPFDGAKIFSWNKTVYTIAVILALGLFVASLAL
jgi:Zn-dependent protease